MIQKLSRFASAIFALALLVGCGPATPIAHPGYVPSEPVMTPNMPLSDSPSVPVITPENIDQLQEISRIGKGNLQSVVLSPDGKAFAVTASTGIYLFDSGKLTELKHIQGTAIEFSPDNRYFSVDSSLYNRETLEVNAIFENQRILFSSDGKVISAIPISGDIPVSYDNDLGILHTWGWQWSETSAIINDGGSKMATSNGQVLNIWEYPIIGPSETFQLEFPLRPIRFLKSDQFLLLAGSDFLGNCDGPALGFAVMDIDNGEIIFQTRNCIYWSPPIFTVTENDSKITLLYPEYSDPDNTANYGVFLAVINLTSRTYQKSFVNPQTYNNWTTMSTDGKTLALEKDDGMEFWKIGDAPVFDKTIQGIRWVNFSPDNSKFFALTSDWELEMREMSTSNILCKIDGAGRSVSISYSTNSNRALVWDGRYQELILWDMDTCETQRMIWPSFSSFPQNISFSSDSKLLASPGLAFPWVYDMETRQFLDRRPKGSPMGNIWGVAFLPNSHTLAVGGENIRRINNKRGFLYTWNLTSELEVNSVLVSEVVQSVHITVNNRIITREIFGPKSKVWDEKLTNISGETTTLMRQDNEIAGRIRVSETKTSVIFSDARTGKNLRIITKGEWNGIIFSPDGRWMAVINNDGTISLWGIPQP